MSAAAYDAPAPRTARISGQGFDREVQVRELSAFQIARNHSDMLAVAAALYSQEAVRTAVATGQYEGVTFHPIAVLGQVPDQLQRVLCIATGEPADIVEAISFEALPMLIATFVEANAPFFTDYCRRLVEAGTGQQASE